LVNGTTPVKINLKLTPLRNTTLFLIGSQGIIQSKKLRKTSSTWTVDIKNTSYLRFEVRDANQQMLIISNPIWIKSKS
jgi:hypothetical protein